MVNWQRKRKAMDIKEPWTAQENAAYQERDKNFIRNIQLKDGYTKPKAIKLFNDYINSSDKSKKKLKIQSEIQRFLTGRNEDGSCTAGSSPKERGAMPISGEHKRIKPAKQTGKKRKPISELTPKVRTRLINGRKKFKDASDFEVFHGVNSKASEKYRLRHGQGRYYEGRIVEKEKKK